MSEITSTGKCGPDTERSLKPAAWLSLAASPTFALMAWIWSGDMQAMAGASGSDRLSIGSMAFIYLLMALFHLPPWLELAPSQTRQPQTTTQVQGD